MYPPQQVYPWQQQQEEPQQPQPQIPEWDRSKFRDMWMSSGVRDVPGMQKWLSDTGWGQHVGSGGSKGDKMYLPGGETIDAVYAAGLGGNRAGPMWTGSGNWQQEGRTPYQGGGGMGPSPQMMQGMWGGQQGGAQQMPWGGRQFDPRQQQMQMHKMWQQGRQQQQRSGGMRSRYVQPQGGMQSQKQSQMQQPQYMQNKGMYY